MPCRRSIIVAISSRLGLSLIHVDAAAAWEVRFDRRFSS
jgi:hypothetical protein